MKKIEFNEQCRVCHGTGLYVGLGERDGAAVVCHDCKGTGCFHFVHEYEEFAGRRENNDVTHVFEANPGICIGTGNGQFKLSDFGGMTYEAWKGGLPFPPGSENRRCTCPAWWYQSVCYAKKPNWKECGFGAFSKCQHFPNKDACWARWDALQSLKPS